MYLVAAIGFSYFGIMHSRGGLYEICIDCSLATPIYDDIDAFNATDDGHNPPVRTNFKNPIGTFRPWVINLGYIAQVAIYR